MDSALTPDEAHWAACLARAEERAKQKELERFPVGHSSRVVFERSAEVYRVIAEKLERQADSKKM
jgi:hypothetical protein